MGKPKRRNSIKISSQVSISDKEGSLLVIEAWQKENRWQVVYFLSNQGQDRLVAASENIPNKVFNKIRKEVKKIVEPLKKRRENERNNS